MPSGPEYLSISGRELDALALLQDVAAFPLCPALPEAVTAGDGPSLAMPSQHSQNFQNLDFLAARGNLEPLLRRGQDADALWTLTGSRACSRQYL